MVIATGVEPATFGSANRRSIQLSYATTARGILSENLKIGKRGALNLITSVFLNHAKHFTVDKAIGS